LAAGAFKSIEEAQKALCPDYRIFEPAPESVPVYQELFSVYEKLYFALGQKGSKAAEIGDVLPAIREIAARMRMRGAQ